MMQSTGQKRIEELEAALADAIEHLAMYRHFGVSADKAAQLQQVLEGSPLKRPARARVAEHFTSAGIPMMRAELLGDELVLSTRTPKLTEQRLLEALRGDGYVMKLKQLERDDPYTPRERARIENDGKAPKT